MVWMEGRICMTRIYVGTLGRVSLECIAKALHALATPCFLLLQAVNEYIRKLRDSIKVISNLSYRTADTGFPSFAINHGTCCGEYLYARNTALAG